MGSAFAEKLACVGDLLWAPSLFLTILEEDHCPVLQKKSLGKVSS